MQFSRLSIVAFLVFGLLALPAQAQSQQSQSQHETTVGLGVSVANWGSGGSTIIGSPLSLSVPVTFSSFRVEPELGYYRSQASSDNHGSTLYFGTGAFYLSQLEDFQFQIGARFGLSRDSYASGSGRASNDHTNVDYAVGPALGGEYYVGDHLSLGLEARLLYTNMDQERDEVSRTNSIVNTEAAGYVRIHF